MICIIDSLEEAMAFLDCRDQTVRVESRMGTQDVEMPLTVLYEAIKRKLVQDLNLQDYNLQSTKSEYLLYW